MHMTEILYHERAAKTCLVSRLFASELLQRAPFVLIEQVDEFSR